MHTKRHFNYNYLLMHSKESQIVANEKFDFYFLLFYSFRLIMQFDWKNPLVILTILNCLTVDSVKNSARAESGPDRMSAVSFFVRPEPLHLYSQERAVSIRIEVRKFNWNRLFQLKCVLILPNSICRSKK